MVETNKSATPEPPLHEPLLSRTVLSEDLFRTARRVVIRHRGKDYVLIITRQDKLVLNRLS